MTKELHSGIGRRGRRALGMQEAARFRYLPLFGPIRHVGIRGKSMAPGPWRSSRRQYHVVAVLVASTEPKTTGAWHKRLYT